MRFEKGASVPLKRGGLFLAVPASTFSDIPHLREKTLKIASVGRAAAIFRVDEIILFPDLPRRSQRKDADLITSILSYMETPQYLRKRLFEIRPELRYVGILPPLRTPHHPLSRRKKDLAVGEYREGVVISSSKDKTLVDIGVEHPVSINSKLRVNTRITVKMTEIGKRLRVCLAKKKEIEEYWGYRVTFSTIPLGSLVNRGSFDLVVATSRHGTSLRKIWNELERFWRNSEKILLIFGSPTQGLHEIIANEGIELGDISHFVINTIPCQGTETVRTEEAIFSTLSIMNAFFA